LHRGHQQANQDRDDGNDNQQLNQGKCGTFVQHGVLSLATRAVGDVEGNDEQMLFRTGFQGK
jgi:hypothetical protein